MFSYSYIYLEDKVYISIFMIDLYEKKYEFLVSNDDDYEYIIGYEENSHLIVETDPNIILDVVGKMLSILFMILE